MGYCASRRDGQKIWSFDRPPSFNAESPESCTTLTIMCVRLSHCEDTWLGLIHRGTLLTCRKIEMERNKDVFLNDAASLNSQSGYDESSSAVHRDS